MKFDKLVVPLALLPVAALGQHGDGPFQRNQIKSLVTFGDSFTDIVAISNGGTQWPVYVAGYAGIQLFPYARSGATCSNNITFRPFPPVFESQIPAFLEDKENKAIEVDGKGTLYTLWIGTNDIGVSSLVTGGNSASIVDVAGCMVNWVQTMYDNGARNFLFQNVSLSTSRKFLAYEDNRQMVPLETIPLYSANSWPNKFWHFQRNTTEWSLMIREMVLSGNTMVKLMLQDLAPKLHGAHVG